MLCNQCKFVGLEVSNPTWKNIGQLIESDFHQYINISKCGSWGRLFEPEPHVTLYYSEENDKGPNWMYWLVSILGRDLYTQLSNVNKLTLTHLHIDTFKNQDSIVLKVNLRKSNCNLIELLDQYHQFIESKCIPGEYPEYNPHLTITHLLPNTSDEVISKLIEGIQNIPNLLSYDITNIMLGGGKDSLLKSKLPIK